MRLNNWSQQQEVGFQQVLRMFQDARNDIPQLMIRPLRKTFRDRKYTPSQMIAWARRAIKTWEEDKAAKRLPGMVNSPYPDLPRWDR